MRRVDNHSHILLARLADMVDAAKAYQVDELSITEHVSQFREPRDSFAFGSVHLTGRIFSNLSEYAREFEKFHPLDDEIRINR